MPMIKNDTTKIELLSIVNLSIIFSYQKYPWCLVMQSCQATNKKRAVLMMMMMSISCVDNR